ncbi:MAG: DNA adenine methylase [Sandaracinaceae bacterium]|nr:DNA adenine methylase [Sandaracinaceae bacterium]
MIKYIGSKRLLLPPIVAAARAFGDVRSALDLFSGTARVARALKQTGLHVIANDHNAYAATLARCYVQADARRWREPAERLIAELRSAPACDGYFTQTFARDARYLQPHNAMRVDGIRDAIAELDLPQELEAIALTSLMEGADRVDSTTGVQMAYLKEWSARSHRDLELRVPELVEGCGCALELDALEAAGADADVAYVDPPYNQHSYLGNYHVWETLVRWDAPATYGIANKRIDCKDRRSPFNRRHEIAPALERVIAALRAKHLVVSFSDEGYLDRDELERMLASRGHVRVISIDYKRYVGAQIGIYNLKGQKVGRVSHLRNRELLFLVSPHRAAVDRAAEAASRELAGQ